jgi:amidase
MKRVTRRVVYCQTGRYNPPALTVHPGETVLVETELCTGDWLHDIDDRWRPGIGFGPNPASGPLYVEGAGPGDALAVRIDGIALGSLGYTGFGPGMNPFPDWIRRREWGVVTRTVRIRDGFVEWDERLRLPVRPMVGLLGTAPEFEVLSNARNGRHGGNMDVQEVTTGATVYLPVYVPGALLHVGDVHALQGDGEICCGGGIETRSEVTLTIAGVSPRPARMSWPRIVDSEHLMTVGCARPAEDAFRIAVQELVYWLCDDYGFEESEAILFLGQVLEARCTQFVDPEYTYIAKVRREYLPAVRAERHGP